MLLRIMSRSFEAAMLRRGHDALESVLKPATVLYFKNSLRFNWLFLEPIGTSKLELMSIPTGNNHSSSTDLHIPRKDFFIGTNFPIYVLRYPVDIRQIVERDKRNFVHENLASLLQYSDPLLHVGRFLLFLN